MKIQQQEIEFGVRRQVGLWLRDAVQEGERVYLEPVGYIGYFSNAAILDFPGLVSPEVTALKETENAGFKEVAQRLRPAWLVLRPDEARLLFADSPDLGAAYQLAEVFSARARLDSYEYIPGRGYLELDAERSTVAGTSAAHYPNASANARRCRTLPSMMSWAPASIRIEARRFVTS